MNSLTQEFEDRRVWALDGHEVTRILLRLKGGNNTAQGNALGLRHQKPRCPEGAKQLGLNRAKITFH
jgi:hypothetical protein